MNDQSVTLPAKPNALPEIWIENIFQKMEDRYGTGWSDRYGQFPRQRVKKTWAEDLAGLTREELTRGLNACKRVKYPPYAPEFLALCRPDVHAEAAFSEAVVQLHRRKEGRDTWSHPAIYWAAHAIGEFDVMNQPWASIKGRWTVKLNEMLAEEVLPEVPPYRVALPAPGKTVTPPEVGHKMIAAALALLKPKQNIQRDWIDRILTMEKDGRGKPTFKQLEVANAARAALGGMA